MSPSRQKKSRVRELRKRNQMTQAQLARKANLGLRTLQYIEAGRRCRTDTQRKILRAIGKDFRERGRIFP